MEMIESNESIRATIPISSSRLFRKTARLKTGGWIFWIAGALAVLSSIPSLAMGHALQLANDTVSMSEAAHATMLETPPCRPCWGQEMNYTAFYDPSVTFVARRYDGFDVTLYVPRDGEDAQHMTPERVRRLVERLDFLYRAYRDLLNWAPARVSDPNGKHVFALLPTHPDWFYGLAYIGGDRSEYIASVMLEDALDADVLSNVWVHELAHNFDPINVWDVGPDAAHNWTAFISSWFARHQLRMDEIGGIQWDEFERQWLRERWQPYVDDPLLSWEECAFTVPMTARCNSAGVRDPIGSLGIVIGQHATSTQMRNWLRAGIAANTTSGDLNTPVSRFAHMLRTLSEVTGTDTQCIADAFRIPVQVPTLGVGTPLFAGCRDTDADGVPRWFDCDDTRTSAFPGASEVQDGRDNDCDGMIDERVVSETDVPGADFAQYPWEWGQPTPVGRLPLEINGSLRPRAAGVEDDWDSFAPQTPSVSTLQVTLCNEGMDQIILWGVRHDNMYFIALAQPASCSTNILRGDAGWDAFQIGRWGEAATGLGGGWKLALNEIETRAWPHPRAVTLRSDTASAAFAEIDATRVPGGLNGVELRWSTLRSGVVKAGPISNPANLHSPRSADLQTDAFGGLRIRASLWRNGLPIEEPSTAYSLGTATLRFDSAAGPTAKTILRNSGTPVTFAWKTTTLPSGTTCKIVLRPNDSYNKSASPAASGTVTDTGIHTWSAGTKALYLRCSNGTISPDVTLTISAGTPSATLRFDVATGPATKTIIRNSGTPVTFAWITRNLPSGTSCKIVLRPNDSYNKSASPAAGGTVTDAGIHAWSVGTKALYLRCSNGTVSPDVTLTISGGTPSTTLRFDSANGPTSKTIVRNSGTPVKFAWATANLPSGTSCKILLRPNDGLGTTASPVSGGTVTNNTIHAWSTGQKLFYLRCSNGSISPDIALTINPA